MRALSVVCSANLLIFSESQFFRLHSDFSCPTMPLSSNSSVKFVSDRKWLLHKSNCFIFRLSVKFVSAMKKNMSERKVSAFVAVKSETYFCNLCK